MNLHNIFDYNEKLKIDIDKIINEKKIENKLKLINEIYEKMIINNEITLKYKSDLADDCQSPEDKYCLIYDEIVQKIKQESQNDEFQKSLEDIKGEIEQISETFNTIKNDALDNVEDVMKDLE